MSEDTVEARSRRTIGLTQQGKEALATVKAKGWFRTEMGVFKAAVAYAIANGLQETTEGSFTTGWNLGSLDPEGDFEQTCKALLDVDDDPWDRIRRLADAGIRKLASDAAAAEVPSEVFGFAEEAL